MLLGVAFKDMQKYICHAQSSERIHLYGFCCAYLFSHEQRFLSLKWSLINNSDWSYPVSYCIADRHRKRCVYVYMCFCCVLSVFVLFYMYHEHYQCTARRVLSIVWKMLSAWRTYKCEALLSFVKDLLIHLGKPSERESEWVCVRGVYMLLCWYIC